MTDGLSGLLQVPCAITGAPVESKPKASTRRSGAMFGKIRNHPLSATGDSLYVPSFLTLSFIAICRYRVISLILYPFHPLESRDIRRKNKISPFSLTPMGWSHHNLGGTFPCGGFAHYNLTLHPFFQFRYMGNDSHQTISLRQPNQGAIGLCQRLRV